MDPRVGDICTTRRGKTRTARSVAHVEIRGVLEHRIAYEHSDGLIVTVDAQSWATWCARAVRQHGRYRRAEEPS